MTKEQAKQEFNQLLNDDEIFANQWNNTLKDFLEWCSLYADTKHIHERRKNDNQRTVP